MLKMELLVVGVLFVLKARSVVVLSGAGQRGTMPMHGGAAHRDTHVLG